MGPLEVNVEESLTRDVCLTHESGQFNVRFVPIADIHFGYRGKGREFTYSTGAEMRRSSA